MMDLEVIKARWLDDEDAPVWASADIAALTAEVARLRAVCERQYLELAEHVDDDGTDLTVFYRERCGRMAAVVEAARSVHRAARLPKRERAALSQALFDLYAALRALDTEITDE